MEDKKCFLMHELMNCLTVVIGQCELLEAKAGLDRNERLAIIRERASHMAELIRHYDCPAQYDPQHEGLLKTLVRAAISRVEQ